MNIKYYIDYTVNKKDNYEVKGNIELDRYTIRMMETACKTRGIKMQNVIEHIVKNLTIEEFEKAILQMTK